MIRNISVAFALALVAPGCGLIPGGGEWVAELYVGPNFPEDQSIKVSSGGLSGSDTVDFDEGAVVGGRFGRWFSLLDAVHLGAMVDVSRVKQDIDSAPDSADLEFYPVSLLAMARLPFLVSDDFPQGRLHPYAAVGPSVVVNDIDADSFKDTNVDPGLDARAGLSFMFLPALGAFVEYRFTYFEADFSDTISGTATDIEFDSLTNYLLFGASYRF